MPGTLLCIPPDYDRNYPPLGTPALCAFLKKNAFECSQVDLNIMYGDFLARRITGPSTPDLWERRALLKPVLRKFFSENVKDRYYSELLQCADGPAIRALPYENNTNSSFHFCERLLASEHLRRYLEDGRENSFSRFYNEDGIVGLLEKEKINVIGISIISPTQVIASLTLGLLIKNSLPQIHVTIGGQWATLYKEEIMRKKELFDCFDSVIVFEAETALTELVRSLRSGKDIASIPGVILRDTAPDSVVKRVDRAMDELPCPDFEGLPLRDYHGSKEGKMSLTFETSRGCYWSKCAYCVDLPLPKPSYRRKDPRLVVRDMKELKTKYGAQYLLFGDPGLSPRQMREISRLMIKEGVDMELWTMARLDPGFDRKLFDLAFAAGFRQINFGFESANDRVCASLDKGNLRERSSRVIRDCSSAGIRVDLQTMLGLPGESFEDGLDTIDFLLSHKEYISNVTFNTYYLTPFNYVHQNPEKFGIEYDKGRALPFGFFVPFKNRNGMDSDQVEILEKIYCQLAGKNEESKSVQGPDGEYKFEKQITFQLNGQSSTLKYDYDKETDAYTFLEDEKAPLHDASYQTP